MTRCRSVPAGQSGRGSRAPFAGTGLSLPASRRVVWHRAPDGFTKIPSYQRYEVSKPRGCRPSRRRHVLHTRRFLPFRYKEREAIAMAGKQDKLMGLRSMVNRPSPCKTLYLFLSLVYHREEGRKQAFLTFPSLSGKKALPPSMYYLEGRRLGRRNRPSTPRLRACSTELQTLQRKNGIRRIQIGGGAGPKDGRLPYG
jgi:hypothetical protein